MAQIHARAIGSVLPFPDVAAGPPRSDSLWAMWTKGRRFASCFCSARAALAALLHFRRVERCWLSAYTCPDLAARCDFVTRLWYDVNAHLDPDITSLAKKIRANDCIVVTSYFGRPIADNIKAIAASRPDVLWIEDRAQALDSGCSSWADVVLYSPRKLIGVADGGVLVSDTTLPEPSAPVVPRSADAQLARRRDPDGHNPSLWFPAFRMQEEMFKHDDGAMSEATQYILERIALPPISERRRSNAGFLAAHLGDILLWPDDKIVYAPLAVPICVQERDSLAENLAGHGIFCARHWAKLPSAPELFPMAHQLSNALLSLPCDQRYDISDMTRIVKTVRAHDAKRPIL